MLAPATTPHRVAVVGAGAAGLACAIAAAGRGHRVTLFEAADRIGGQLNMACVIPGKEEFHGLVDWFAGQVSASGVDLRLNSAPDAASLAGFDTVVIATGVAPRDPAIPGQDLPHVLSYINVLHHRRPVGPRVAIIGAGGIGFDVAEFLTTDHSPTEDLPLWLAEWGVGDPALVAGGLAPGGPRPVAPVRQVTLLQRKAEKPGRGWARPPAGSTAPRCR